MILSSAEDLSVFSETLPPSPGVRPRRVVIADANDAGCRHTLNLLRDAGYLAYDVPDVGRVLHAMRQGLVDIAVVNADVSDNGGLEFLRDAGRQGAGLPVILYTGSYNVDRAVDAMKQGACDYLTRPFTKSRLLAAVADALKAVEARAPALGAVELAERRRQAQRQAAYGSLAGDALHQLSNCLTVSMGHADVLLSTLEISDPENPMVQHLDQISKSHKGALDFLEQMKVLARKTSPCPCDLDLNLVVIRLGLLLRALIRANVQVHVTSNQALGYIHADTGQMEQMLINLALNARDAMPHGGSMFIRADNVDVDRPRGPVPAGSYVVLSVRDTGSGMPDDVKARMYEPYFSTREPMEGIGLGLTAVREIVAAAGGHLTCDSHIGRGTEFLVYLPRVQAAPTLVGMKTIVQDRV
jgi:signal transduction histidine kinase